MNVKFKKLTKHASTPTYSKEGDAGLDLVAVDTYHDRDYSFVEYGTGLAVEIPEGYVGLLFPRSSISKTDFSLANSVGIIDSNYRGEVKMRFRTRPYNGMEYDIGDRIGQLVIMPYPKIDLVEVTELSDSNRGAGGFGSSGN
jgi:dUTP pyrophosphatase